MNAKYSIPKVNKSKENAWYVHLRYNGIQKRYKKNLNLIEDLKEREKYFNLLAEALHEKLREGWNPTIPALESFDNEMRIIEALEFALIKKRENISAKTDTAYTSAFNFFSKATKKLKLENLLINEVRRVHVKTIFEKIKLDRKWSNKSYNKNLGFIKSIFSELLDWDKIENNPAHGIKALKVEETNANVVANDDQIELIKEHLLKEFPSFYYYIVTIFHIGLRPDELLQVKVSMVDLEKKEIKIPAKITKTNIDRIVPINPFMESYLSEILDSEINNDYFLFGSTREHNNRGVKKETDFICGKNRLNRDAASKLWRKLIKTDLGVDVNMYSMKHLGGDKKILAGIDLDTVRELYGHTSKRMTLRYVKSIKEIYRNQLIDKSPDF